MRVLEAVEGAIKSATDAYMMGGDTEPVNKVSLGRLVALQAIANVLDLEFSEVADQYLAEVLAGPEVPCKS